MANFETNQWYQLSVAASDEMSLLGTSIYNTTTWTGASFFNYTNTNASSYRWQIFPINSSTYALRSGDSGPKSFLGTAWAKSETYPGATRSLIVQNNVSDESVYWNIKPWGDGTFYMTNAANGSSWHLGWHNGLAILDSNITEPQPGQSWSFKPIKNATIDDSAYSSVNLPSATVTTSSTGSATGAPSTTSTNTSSSSGGLSTAAKAGIGAGIGGAALIALVVLGLFLWRRRSEKNAQPPYHYGDVGYQQPPPEMDSTAPRELGSTPVGGAAVKYEMCHDSNVKHEMPSQPIAQQMSPVELPDTTIEHPTSNHDNDGRR